MSGADPLPSMSVLGSEFIVDSLGGVQEKVINIIFCELDEAIKKGGDFNVGRIMIDGSDFWGGVSLMIALNNMIKVIEHMGRIANSVKGSYS